MLLPVRNKVRGRIKQGGGPDSARGPCVCHLCPRLSHAKAAKEGVLKSQFYIGVTGVLSSGACARMFS